MKHSEIIKKMTLKQKAEFVSGLNYWYLQSAPELGLPKIMMTDGPHGLRKQNTEKRPDGIGLGNSVPSTCFPPAVTSACSWDEDLLKLEGEAIAEECLQEKVSVILGPGTNIKRSPVCGRNFEYFSEDPLLAGKCSAALVNGVQSKGVGTSLKHFACNSQEAFRMVIDEIIDDRAIRELYLTAFEICVKESKPWTVMNSYNKINGVYSAQNKWLQEKVLRDEWGFDGLIVTDWGASVDRVPGLECGTDLEMPSSGTLNKKKIIEAVKSGELDEKILDKAVDNVVELILKSKPALEKKHKFDVNAHHRIAQKIAENAMVLLKNEDNILPVKKSQKVAIIGEMAKSPRFQGAGTSVINPTMLDNAYDELVKLGADVVYAQGYNKSEDKIDDKLINDAVNTAKKADVVLIFAGLTEGFEAEGYDRKNIEMPNCHNYLISEIAKVNPNTVVVLAGGSVIHMPWIHEVKALLNSGLGGQAGEEKEVSVELSKRAFAFWNVNINDWMVETGEFNILVGASSRDIKLSKTITVESTDIAEIPDYRKNAPAYYTADINNMNGRQFESVYGKSMPSPEMDRNKKIDIYCCINDAGYTKWGSKIAKLIKFIMTKMGSAENGDGAMLAAMATQIPIRNFVQMSMGVFSPKMAEGLLNILNDDESSFIGFNKIFWRIGGALIRLPKLFKSI